MKNLRERLPALAAATFAFVGLASVFAAHGRGLDPFVWLSALAVYLTLGIALGLVIFVAKEPSAKDIGVALLSGLVLAGAAFALQGLFDQALQDRERDRREAETKLAINRREQFSFRSEDLAEFDLSGLAFVSTDGESFDLSFADLTGTKLVDTELSGARLWQARLRGADLTRADLSGASLREADLTGATLREANLTGADFAGADLGGADLTGAVGFDERIYDPRAKLDERTKCPQGGDRDGGTTTTTTKGEADPSPTCESTSRESEATPGAELVFMIPKDAPSGTIVGQVVTRNSADVTPSYRLADQYGDCAKNSTRKISAGFAIDPSTGLITTVAEDVVLDETAHLCIGVNAAGANDRVDDRQVRAEGQSNTSDVYISVAVRGTEIPPPVPAPELAFVVGSDVALESAVGAISTNIEEPTFKILGSGGLFSMRVVADGFELVVVDELEANTTHQLTVVIADDANDTTVAVPVQVIVTEPPPDPAHPAAIAASRLFIVEANGELTAMLLTQDQIDAGLRVELVSDHDDRLDIHPSERGLIAYTDTGEEPLRRFIYRIEGHPGSETEVTVATVEVNEADEGQILTDAVDGAPVATIDIPQEPPATIGVELDGRQRSRFALADGQIVLDGTGTELFQACPWPDLSVRFTASSPEPDAISGSDSPPLPLEVEVDLDVVYVVQPNDTVEGIARRALGTLADEPLDRADVGRYVDQLISDNGLDQRSAAIDPDRRLLLPVPSTPPSGLRPDTSCQPRFPEDQLNR